MLYKQSVVFFFVNWAYEYLVMTFVSCVPAFISDMVSSVWTLFKWSPVYVFHTLIITSLLYYVCTFVQYILSVSEASFRNTVRGIFTSCSHWQWGLNPLSLHERPMPYHFAHYLCSYHRQSCYNDKIYPMYFVYHLGCEMLMPSDF